MKPCIICKISKELNQFYAHRMMTDGTLNKCKACCIAYALNRAKQDPDAHNTKNRAWRNANLHKARNTANDYVRRNLPKVKAACAKRRAMKLGATPAWLTPLQYAELKAFYAACPAGYHVDHILPLQGKEVCGLHVLWNLQYLPASENIRKGNRVF